MKPYVRGKNIFFREITVEDAAFVLDLRTDPQKGQHLSVTSNDILRQRDYISNYISKDNEYYFVICGLDQQPRGTIRIYDIQGLNFSWGSWLLSREAAATAGIESALLIYDFAFFSLHLQKSHFDVRRQNTRVIDFHKRFGATVVREDEIDVYLEFHRDTYTVAREKYQRFLP